MPNALMILRTTSSGATPSPSYQGSRAPMCAAAPIASPIIAGLCTVPSSRSGRSRSMSASRSSNSGTLMSTAMKCSGSGMSHTPALTTMPKFDCWKIPSTDGP